MGGGGGTGIFQPTIGETLTVRDSRTCNPGDQWFTPNGIDRSVFLSAKIYRNYYYQGETPGDFNKGAVIYGRPTTIKWGGGSPLKQVLSDNVFYDTGPHGVLVNYINSRDWLRAGSVIDRNSYYVPNTGDGYLGIDGTAVSFSKWQNSGWDENGNVSRKPAWPSPSTCDFGSWPYR